MALLALAGGCELPLAGEAGEAGVTESPDGTTAPEGGTDAAAVPLPRDDDDDDGNDGGLPTMDAATSDGAALDAATAAVCPGGADLKVTIAAGKCMPKKGRYADGHCAETADCAVECCRCASSTPGRGFSAQACVTGKCVGGSGACACARKADFLGLLCK